MIVVTRKLDIASDAHLNSDSIRYSTFLLAAVISVDTSNRRFLRLAMEFEFLLNQMKTLTEEKKRSNLRLLVNISTQKKMWIRCKFSMLTSFSEKFPNFSKFFDPQAAPKLKAAASTSSTFPLSESSFGVVLCTHSVPQNQ